MPKAFVLLSGGVDSTTCLHLALAQFEEVVGVSFDYGQRHSKEIEFAALSCQHHGITHEVLSVKELMPKTMLTDKDADVPNVSYSEIKGVSPTYVPFRNGLMLSVLAAFIQGQLSGEGSVGESGLFFGAHSEDAQDWAYPDCTPEFTGAMANAIYIGTYGVVRLHTPLQWLNKAQVVALGHELGVDWTKTWSCYKGGELHCGQCPTCRSRRDAFIKAQIQDPTEYEHPAT